MNVLVYNRHKRHRFLSGASLSSSFTLSSARARQFSEPHHACYVSYRILLPDAKLFRTRCTYLGPRRQNRFLVHHILNRNISRHAGNFMTIDGESFPP
ncbi:hypothetical protein Mapa_010764 [Marchantia paleacea]|nr:hypothetical protein Mapa_010764 [Marchantia paleacea]